MSARQIVSADPTSCLPVHRAIAPEPAAVVESTSSDGGSPKSYVLITLPFVIIILILTSALLTAGGEWRQLPYPTVIQGSTSGTFTEIPPPPQNLRPTTEDWPIRVFNFLTCPMWSGKTYLMIPSALHRYTILLYTASTAAHVFSMVGIWLVTESLVNAGQPISSWYQDIIHVFHNNLAGQAFLLPYDIEPVLSDVIFAFHDFVIVFFTWLMPVALVQHQLARHSLTPESAAAAASGVPHRKNVSQSGKRLPWHPSRRRLLLLLLCTIPLVMCLLALAVAAIVFATISNPPFSLINLFYIGELFSYVLASAALWIQARYHGDAHKLSEDEVAPLTEEPRKSPLTQGALYRRSMHEMQSMQPEVMGYDGDEFDDPESEIGVAYYNENDPNETRGSIALPRLRVTSGYTSKKRRAAPLGTTWADLPNTIQVEVHRLVAIWSFLLFTTFLFRTVAMGYRPAFVLLPSAIPVEQTPNVVSSVTLRVLVNIFILMLPAAYVAVQRTVLFFGRRWLFGGRGSDSGGIEVLRMDPSRGFWAPAIDNGVSTAWSTEDGNNASFQRRLQSRGYMAGAAVRSSSRHSQISASGAKSGRESIHSIPNQVQPVTSPQYVLRSSGSNGSGTGIARPGQMRNITPQSYSDVVESAFAQNMLDNDVPAPQLHSFHPGDPSGISVRNDRSLRNSRVSRDEIEAAINALVEESQTDTPHEEVVPLSDVGVLTDQALERSIGKANASLMSMNDEPSESVVTVRGVLSSG